MPPRRGLGAALLVGVVAVFVNTTAFAFQGSEVTVKEWTAIVSMNEGRESLFFGKAISIDGLSPNIQIAILNGFRILESPKSRPRFRAIRALFNRGIGLNYSFSLCRIGKIIESQFAVERNFHPDVDAQISGRNMPGISYINVADNIAACDQSSHATAINTDVSPQLFFWRSLPRFLPNFW